MLIDKIQINNNIVSSIDYYKEKNIKWELEIKSKELKHKKNNYIIKIPKFGDGIIGIDIINNNNYKSKLYLQSNLLLTDLSIINFNNPLLYWLLKYKLILEINSKDNFSVIIKYIIYDNKSKNKILNYDNELFTLLNKTENKYLIYNYASKYKTNYAIIRKKFDD